MRASDRLKYCMNREKVTLVKLLFFKMNNEDFVRTFSANPDRIPSNLYIPLLDQIDESDEDNSYG